MSSPNRQVRERELIVNAVARLRAGILAIVGGMLGGLGLFVATAWLLVRGGSHVGAHLQLLSHYYPGYSVSWRGALLGLIYGGLSGAFLGLAVGFFYNRIADWRERG